MAARGEWGIEVGDVPVTREERKLQKLQSKCDVFNTQNPIGSKVLVRRDSGGNLITYTRSEAYVLSGHTPVVFVEGISGCYDLSRVEKIFVHMQHKDGKLEYVNS